MWSLVVMGGILVPVQLAANSRIRDAIGSAPLAIMISFIVGAAGLGALTATGLLGRGQISGIANVPGWAWIGGFLSAFAVMVSMMSLKPLGAGAVIAAMVFGQLASAMVIDHFGWLAVEKNPIDVYKIIGALLLLVGALMMQHK